MVNKVCGVVTVAGNLGLIDAIKDLYFFITVHRMLPANCVAAYAIEKGEVRKREQGMKAAWELGREVVQLAMKKFEFPREFMRVIEGYGTVTD